MTPDDRKYAKTHEWVKLEGNVAVVGISEHAQGELGDVTFVDLPRAGAPVEAGKECGVIESVKAASDLYAPVSGEIESVNSALDGTPELINQDPFEKGWILKIRNVDPAALDALMSAAEYEASVSG